MPELLVGIDVAKDSSSAQGIDSSGNGQFSLGFDMDSQGFMQLWKAITEHSKNLSEVIVAVESTACYHINLYSFLTAKGVTTVVINPLLISNFSKLSLRKTKTDKRDAMTIAQFLLMNPRYHQPDVVVPGPAGLPGYCQGTGVCGQHAQRP